MSHRLVAIAHFAAATLLAGCRAAPPAAQPAAQQAASPAVSSGGQSPENQAANNATMQRVLERIAGREAAPAESVFRNVQYLKGISARTFLSIMNGGYAAALGVQCVHCHVEGNFASDDKRPKRAAREMAVMHRMINTQLREMTELATPPSQNRAINCSTCHRGTVNPRAPAGR